MVAVTYIEHDGTRHTVEAEPGMNLMECAVLNMVPGVEGMCGGICSCATCHCYIPPQWQERIPEPGMGEKNMLRVASHGRPNSRLGCQIVVSEALDGIEIHLPVEQGG
jgi:ferredoxin, 2Fe-2S